MALKHLVHRFDSAAGLELFCGPELVVKGALETPGGVELITGYPRGPIGGLFETVEGLRALLAEQGVATERAGNEALASAIAAGARQAGGRVLLALGGTGLQRGGEALSLAVRQPQRHGGLVVVIGQDQNESHGGGAADSAVIARQLGVSLLEPSCAQEIKDWVELAFTLCAAGQGVVAMRLRPWLLLGGATVQCRPNQRSAGVRGAASNQPSLLSGAGAGGSPWLPGQGRAEMSPGGEWDWPSRQAAIKAAARELGLNRVLNPTRKDEVAPLGLIAVGAAYACLSDTLGEVGLRGRIPILRLGMVEPLDERLVVEFARRCRRMLVVGQVTADIESQILRAVEPLRVGGELELHVGGLDEAWSQGRPTMGQEIGPSQTPSSTTAAGRTHPSELIAQLAPVIRDHPQLPLDLIAGRLEAMLRRIEETSQLAVSVPQRTPTFCAGCPQRDVASVLLELRASLTDAKHMLDRHRRRPVTLAVQGDVGCATLLGQEPFVPLTVSYPGMGLGGAAAAGSGKVGETRQVVFLGAATFYHSGQLALRQALEARSHVTFVLVDNQSSGFPGRLVPPLPSGPSFAEVARDIERMAWSIRPADRRGRSAQVVRISPSDRPRLRALLEQTILSDGVHVVIADKACALAERMTPERAEEPSAEVSTELHDEPVRWIMTHPDVCEHCLECVRQTGCPGLTIVPSDYGPKIQTDPSICTSDGACVRIGACPAFEQVTLLPRRAKKKASSEAVTGTVAPPRPALPEPRPVHGSQEVWRCHVAGVGGMGVGTAGMILAEAGRSLGYRVVFLRDHGRAFQTDSASAQVVFTHQGAPPPPQEAGVGDGMTPAGVYAQFTTPLIPFGQADLLLGLDLVEAARAMDPDGPYRAVSPQRTYATVNAASVPTTLGMLGRDSWRAEQLVGAIRRYTHSAEGGEAASAVAGVDVSELCRRELGSTRYVNVVLLGMAFQMGYLPMTGAALELGVRRRLPREAEANLRALDLGRRWVLGMAGNRTSRAGGLTSWRNESAQHVLRRKMVLLRARYRFRGGRRVARRFGLMIKRVEHTARQALVDDALLRDVTVRAYDCLLWGGVRYAQRYVDHVVAVLEKDLPRRDLALTRAVAWNLARVMLIKDEIFVAAMSSDPHHRRQQRRRLGLSPHGKRGEPRLRLRHVHHPQLRWRGHVYRLPPIRTRPWHLRLLARLRPLRGLLLARPTETRFRDWYESLLAKISVEGAGDYERWLTVLSVPASVTGFRAVRDGKILAARRRAEESLAEPAPAKAEEAGKVGSSAGAT
ncbi:MAG: 2-oxoacid:acceptor oxidoreductase family protein [Phycisphaeraceae bacterium]|nr:2-oxoacid:acceptor oxidoreductase family protein [Phycisphaeraceae bacterium]